LICGVDPTARILSPRTAIASATETDPSTVMILPLNRTRDASGCIARTERGLSSGAVLAAAIIFKKVLRRIVFINFPYLC
jgi:hypothetical protein